MDTAEHSQAVISRLRDQLRARGERMTAPRAAVMSVLAGESEHLTADEISSRLADANPEVHRATVYRTLEALCRLGMVQHVHVSNGPTKYHLVHSSRGERHVHAQCVSCGVVVDVPQDVLADAAQRLADDFGFLLDAGHVALSGTCARCASRMAPPHDHGA